MAGRNNSNRKPGNSSVETLTEVFRCFICMEKLQDAHLCPHCSKLCCYACIRRWLTEQRSQCPHCRATLLLFELVNCRWVEEVTQNLESLRAAGSEGSSTGAADNDAESTSERCPEHPGEHLTVFCESCCKCICHRCALWGGTAHAGHSFKPIAEVYEQHAQKIKSEISELQQRQLKLANVMLKVEHSVEVVRQARDEKANELYLAVESMISHLDAQLRANILTLTSRKGLLGQESEKLEAVINDVEHKMSTFPHAELICQSKEILDSIKSIQQRPLSHLLAAPVLGDFKSEMVPPFDSGTFVMQNFRRLQAKGDAVYSPPLHVHGLCWRLKVYPNGNGVVRGLYLSVFLELTAGLPETSKYKYRIEMIHQATQDHQRSIVREFASDFEVGECWGYNRFFRLDVLTREGYMDNANGTLELRFHVRPPTYFQKCRDQEWYISQLQAVEAQYSAQINELKERGKEDTINSNTNEIADSASDRSGHIVRRQLRFNLQSRRGSQICSEEPIRESNVNSDAETGHLSVKSNSDSFKSGTSQVPEIFDSLDDDSDVVSHDPSEEGSSDEVLFLTSSPIRLRLSQESAASPQNTNNSLNWSRFSSRVCSTPRSTSLQRYTFACNRSHPSHFHSLSNVHVEAGDPSPLPTSDYGYDLSDILDSSSNIADEANLPTLCNSEDSRIPSEQDEAVLDETLMIGRRRLPGAHSHETTGIHFKILGLPEELILSSFSTPQAGSGGLEGLGSTVDVMLEESSPRAPPVPHQPSHDLRHLPIRNSCQSCATNQQSAFRTSVNEAGAQVENETSENGNAADEVSN
ncbi:E3 ubiquitin-protein ligase TRIM37-like isoform X2 [Hetaerina americana]|uniref:E3 ubiquitin-protein ligase TRIM37-like isoform X2 n=1 Tax=Hetaerina americana TaxID=62018 RepID=UPI003A7F4BB4